MTLQEMLDKELPTVETKKIRKEIETKTKAETDRLERESLPNKYPHLFARTDNGKTSNSALAAKNIKIELKRAFSGQKFSVTKRGNSINISWEDGPTQAEVNKITGKYEHGYFDPMNDLYEYQYSSWCDVFGSAKYVTENRTVSNIKIIEMAEKFGKKISFDHDGNVQDIEWDFFITIRHHAYEQSYYFLPVK